jgi:hypothetical protein
MDLSLIFAALLADLIFLQRYHLYEHPPLITRGCDRPPNLDNPTGGALRF